MPIKKITWIVWGLASTISSGVAQQQQKPPDNPPKVSSTHPNQLTNDVQIQYIGQIPRDFHSTSHYVNVFRVTIPPSFAQIRINPDQPTGHAPWYTDVYLDQIQPDDQHYLGRLYNNAGIQTAIEKDTLPAHRFGKLAQPVYTANQFYFTAEGVPERLIFLGQSNPTDLKNLKKQYQLQTKTPFVWSIAIDPTITQQSPDDDPCANANDCLLALNNAHRDQPESIVNNGADPWAFNITIKQTLSGKDLDPSTQAGGQAYQHVVFYDGSNRLTAQSLITNLHRPHPQNGQYDAFISILPSHVSNIDQDVYEGTPVYGRFSTQDSTHHQGYYLYTTESETSVTFKAALLEGRTPSSVQTTRLTINALGTLGDIMAKHTLQVQFDATSRDNVFPAKDQSAAHKFTTFNLSGASGFMPLANPDTGFPNYLVFNDGVYLYDNSTMGVCDNRNKHVGPRDVDRFFCQNHTNYDWGWFSWGVNDRKKSLKNLYISDWQFLHPSSQQDYDHLNDDQKLIYQGQNHTNYGNSKLAFDIDGQPYIWQPDQPSGQGVKNHRHNSIDEHELFDQYGHHYAGAVFKNELPFDVMMLLYSKSKDGFRINGPDMYSGFIMPPDGIEKIYFDLGKKANLNEKTMIEWKKSKKYAFFANINGVDLNLGSMMIHPAFLKRPVPSWKYTDDMFTYFSGKDHRRTQEAKDQISPRIFNIRNANHAERHAGYYVSPITLNIKNANDAERHAGPAGIIHPKTFHFFEYDATYTIQNELPIYPTFTLINTSGSNIHFQLTDGKSESFEQVYFDQTDLAPDQAKVIGLFKKDQPKNQEALHFKVDAMTGSIDFRQGQNPNCSLGAAPYKCVVIEQQDTYPRTYVLDIQTQGTPDG